MLDAFTTIAVLDLEHLVEFRLSYPTWAKNAPSITRNPMIVVCDARQSAGWWERQIAEFLDHTDVRIVMWPDIEGADQRHRMLSAFVYAPALYCETEWTLKIDSDCCCMERREEDWQRPEWFTEEAGNVFISSKWGYTRPAQLYIDCCEWAKTIPELADKPEVPGKWDDPQGICSHGRIISFVFWGRTSFMRQLAEWAPPPLLPCASQDTFVWYCAARLGLPFVRTRFSRLGWAHRRRKLERFHLAVMEGDQ